MRDTTLLHPSLQEKIPVFLAKCKEKGLIVKITETFRTVGEQNALYAQGRTKAGSIITNCKGSDYSSMHQWGVAFDFCRNDGKGAFNDSDGFFTKVGKIGESLGLEWGGRWQGFVDRPHFQLKKWGSTASKLKSLYGTYDVFKKTWKYCNYSNYAEISVKDLSNLYEHYKGVKTLQKLFGLKVTGHPNKELLHNCPTVSLTNNNEKIVKAMQLLLNSHDFNLEVNGKLNKATQKAILDFKSRNGIKSQFIKCEAGGKFWKLLLMMEVI